MKIPQAQDEKLLDYLDGTLKGTEKESLEQQIKSSAALQARLEELRTLDAGLRLTRLEQPSKNFTQLVMNRLDQYPVQAKSFSTRNGVLLLIGVLVAVGVGSLLVAGGVFDGTSSIELNQTIVPNKYIQNPLPAIPFNGKLVVNIIIMLNLALAFMVLDKAVLKPWFEKRARMHGVG
jgi:anti-sigma factor RsiW